MPDNWNILASLLGTPRPPEPVEKAVPPEDKDAAKTDAKDGVSQQNVEATPAPSKPSVQSESFAQSKGATESAGATARQDSKSEDIPHDPFAAFGQIDEDDNGLDDASPAFGSAKSSRASSKTESGRPDRSRHAVSEPKSEDRPSQIDSGSAKKSFGDADDDVLKALTATTPPPKLPGFGVSDEDESSTEMEGSFGSVEKDIQQRESQLGAGRDRDYSGRQGRGRGSERGDRGRRTGPSLDSVDSDKLGDDKRGDDKRGDDEFGERSKPVSDGAPRRGRRGQRQRISESDTGNASPSVPRDSSDSSSDELADTPRRGRGRRSGRGRGEREPDAEVVAKSDSEGSSGRPRRRRGGRSDADSTTDSHDRSDRDRGQSRDRSEGRDRSETRGGSETRGRGDNRERNEGRGRDSSNRSARDELRASAKTGSDRDSSALIDDDDDGFAADLFDVEDNFGGELAADSSSQSGGKRDGSDGDGDSDGPRAGRRSRRRGRGRGRRPAAADKDNVTAEAVSDDLPRSAFGDPDDDDTDVDSEDDVLVTRQGRSRDDRSRIDSDDDRPSGGSSRRGSRRGGRGNSEGRGSSDSRGSSDDRPRERTEQDFPSWHEIVNVMVDKNLGNRRSGGGGSGGGRGGSGSGSRGRRR